MNDTNNMYQAKLHWMIFFWPVVFACGAMLIGIQFPQFKQPSAILLALTLVWIIMTWVNFHFSSLTITNKQVILRTGMLVRQTVDIPMTKIETIDIRQSIAGSIFRYGSLVITGTGGTRHMIDMIDNPLTCRRYIEQLMHND